MGFFLFFEDVKSQTSFWLFSHWLLPTFAFFQLCEQKFWLLPETMTSIRQKDHIVQENRAYYLATYTRFSLPPAFSNIFLGKYLKPYSSTQLIPLSL